MSNSIAPNNVWMYLNAEVRGADGMTSKLEVKVSDYALGRDEILARIDDFKRVLLAAYDEAVPPTANGEEAVEAEEADA